MFQMPPGKPSTEFYYIASAKKYQCYCKICLKSFQSKRWKERKRKAIELMGGQCCLCGYKKCISAFEFHHKDPNEKDLDIAVAFRMSWDKLVSELKKCILVCANCHREKHSGDDMFNLERSSGPILERDGALKPTGRCKICNTEVFGTIFCSNRCAGVGRRRSKHPSRGCLQNDLDHMSIEAIGRKYGVSGGAIRKWIKQKNIAHAKPDGRSKHPLYCMYKRMLSKKCTCPEWTKNFNAFAQEVEKLGHRPSGWGLGRIDPSKEYGPGNCKWERQGRLLVVGDDSPG